MASVNKSDIVITRYPEVEHLVKLGSKRGFITYDEMNNVLPDEIIEPDRMDKLLIRLDTM